MINLYSTDRRAKTALVPLVPQHIKMYVCGPTVYDHCHIGHARPAVVFDTIRRFLEFAGYAVTFLSNITDIDDKIIKRAAECGVSCAALASRYQDEYESDMAMLGVRSPSIRPKATEHIPEMIALIQTLLDKGAAYQTSRGVWFDVSKFPAYGKLSGKTGDDEQTEHRVESDSEKKHSADFALWKFAKPAEPQWESPWGAGRPGWHIECSAMSGKYCAMQLDIHGGGADLIFPHHENEIAQSEMASGKEFSRYWLHNGFITVAKSGGGEDKMGKSKGNAFGLREAFKLCGPAALRFWILGTHYRMPLFYKPELLAAAQNSLARIYASLEALDSLAVNYVPPDYFQHWAALSAAERLNGATAAGFGGVIMAAGKKFITAMNDDFNTPQALAAVFELIGEINSAMAAKELTVPAGAAARELLRELLSVLGLPRSRPPVSGVGEKCIQILIDLRNQARAKKDFAAADLIREQLAQTGVEIKDGTQQTAWVVR